MIQENYTPVNAELDEQMHAVLESGVSLVPVGDDKKPVCKWKDYQTKAPSAKMLVHWLGQGHNAFAAICGKVSGGLGCLDFDDNANYPAKDMFDAWGAKCGALVEQYDLPVQRTRGGGYQVHYRCDNPGHNAKLAWIPDSTNDSGRSIAIETRGEGGYAVIAPSFDGAYCMIRGSFAKIAHIPQAVVEQFWQAAREFDLMPVTLQDIAKVKQAKLQSYNGSGEIFQAFNGAYDVRDLLQKHGYTGAVEGGRLVRPNGTRPSVAVVDIENISFHWSTNDPLHRPNAAGNPLAVDAFDVYAFFEHDNDKKAAVKAAAKLLGMEQAPGQRAKPQAGAGVQFAANLLGLAIDAGQPLDDMRAIIARLSDDERKDGTIIEQLYRVLKNKDEVDEWLIDCGHANESKAEKLLTAVRRLDYDFALNTLEDSIEVNGKPITDIVRSEIYLELMGHTKTYIDDAVNVVAKEKAYHPVQRYLNGLQWDGQDHLAALWRHIHVDGQIVQIAGSEKKFWLSHALILRWLLGCVARGLDGGAEQAFKHQTPVLVFMGGQGAGKSTFVKWLSSGIGLGYHVESMVDPERDEHKRQMVTRWLWEISELGSTLKRADREAFKGFVTTEWHTYRPPYGRSLLTRPTLCNLVGTINNETGFLDDPTGNRRFLPVHITGIDHAYKSAIDVNQLWAQVVHLYRSGVSPELDPIEKKLLGEVHKDNEVDNPLQTYLQMYFDIDPVQADWQMHTAAIVERLREFGIAMNPNLKTAARDVNDALAPLGLKADRVTIDGVRGRGWFGIKPNGRAPRYFAG